MPLVGVIDLVVEGNVPVDYKTVLSPYSYEDMKTLADEIKASKGGSGGGGSRSRSKSSGRREKAKATTEDDDVPF